MVRTITKIAMAAVCLLALAVFTPQAKATPTDFQCGTNCGIITQLGSNFSSSAISVTAISFILPGFTSDGTDEVNESFNVNFNTATGQIKITDSTDSDVTLTGTITSFGLTGDRLDLNVTFTSPAGFESFASMHLDLLTGTPCLDPPMQTCTNYEAFSVDIPVTPSPEPASLLLLGTGLLGIGGAVRRRWSN